MIKEVFDRGDLIMVREYDIGLFNTKMREVLISKKDYLNGKKQELIEQQEAEPVEDVQVWFEW
jgi:hypothetical protein